MSILRDAPVDQLSERQAKAELKALAEEMAAHDVAYHGEDAPVISDAAYDALKARNLAIEKRFPDLVRGQSVEKSWRSTVREVRQGHPRQGDAVAGQRVFSRGCHGVCRPGETVFAAG
jgi:hypothetical protein